MKAPGNQPQGKPFLDLLEESLHLLRTAPLSITVCFYFGTIPFVLALLFFCMDFSQSFYSEAEAALAALGMALLYAWMKAWQAIFCQQLRQWLCGASPESWKIRRFPAVFLQQLVLQPTAFLAVPFSLIIALPFGWTYAFYQNLSVLGDGAEPSLKKLCERAWNQAGLWPKQNHMGIWLISPVLFVAASTILLVSFYVFARVNPYWMHAPQLYLIIIALLLLILGLIANPCGAVVALNFGIALFMLPQVLKMLTGIETIFTISTSYMLSAPFLITVCSLTYLTLEPLVKSFYVLRCFYGDSIRTGEDLKAGLQGLMLRRRAQAAAVLVLLLAAFSNASAQSDPLPSPPPAPVPVLSTQNLDSSIDRVMADRKYAWRNPQETPQEDRKKGLFGYFLDALIDRLKELVESMRVIAAALMDWWEDLFGGEKDVAHPPTSLSPAQGSWPAMIQVCLWLLFLFLTFILARALLLRSRKKKPSSIVPQDPVSPNRPDVASESVTATDLESDEWEVLARKLMQEGQLRLALRAFFLSSLSFLGRKDLLQLKRHKTNRDYERELKRQVQARPDLLRCFSQNLALYERSWYGVHEATPETLQIFTQNQQTIRHTLET